MAGSKAPAQCPKCGGDMWDNIDTKKNPKAPDYACKDKQGCGAGIWLTDTQKNAARAQQAPAAGGGGGAPRPMGNIILDTMMYRCLQSAYAMLDKNVKDGKISSYTCENSLNLATTLFISRTRDRSGILRIEKPAPQPPVPQQPPPPPPPPAPLPQQPEPDPRGPGYWDSPGADDDLPF